ncbi:MAG: hypothetical protein EOP60_11445, partial [Sphingomonadales bacterium]
ICPARDEHHRQGRACPRHSARRFRVPRLGHLADAESDDPRSGDFAPLRHVPTGKTVVLGLVTTKLADMETADDVKSRVAEAAKFMPLDQMALSPQCGFSSTVHGNDIAMEQQSAKMQLVIDVARDVWGEI